MWDQSCACVKGDPLGYLDPLIAILETAGAYGALGGMLMEIKDGEPKDSPPKFSNKTKKWLKKHGWKI